MALGSKGDPLRFGSWQQRSVPLALASLVLGSRRPLHGLVKFSSEKFRIWDGKYEAHFERGSRLIDQLSQPPRIQRSLRVLLQSEYRLLGQALGLGDGR
jgi:hypothetical protein